MLKIYNQESIVQERLAKKETRNVAVFRGDKEYNKEISQADVVPNTEAFVQMGTEKWVDSPAYNKHWSEIRMLREKVVNQNSSPSDLANLIQLFFVDVTRRVMEMPDLTSIINIETTNFNYPKSLTLREIYKYRTLFGDSTLENDSVNLVEQFSGAVDHADMEAWTTGWKDTLDNLLYNELFDMQKVLQAVAEAFVNQRNKLTLGDLFDPALITFHTSQKVKVVASTNPYDTDLYDTMRNGYIQIKSLLDAQNGKLIQIPSLALVIHPTRRWEMERVIRGFLETGGANMGSGQIRSSLPINEIIEFPGDSYTWGKKSINFLGCPANKAYLLVPRLYSYTMVKRPLTMEVGRGSVLQLSTEERAWYFVQARYARDLLGSSYPGVTGTVAKGGYGAIVEISLEPEPIET